MRGLFNGAQPVVDELKEKLLETEAMYDAKVEELEEMTQERNEWAFKEKYLREFLIELVGKKIADSYIGGK